MDSSKILDATIVNADVSASAAIADTKLATIATSGKVADTALSANVALRGSTNTFSGNQIFNGNVGIGGTAPGTKLVVEGDSVGNPQILIQGKTNPNGQLMIGYDTTANYGFIAPILQNVSFKPLILNATSVGIGTTTPTQARLQIAGSPNRTGSGLATYWVQQNVRTWAGGTDPGGITSIYADGFIVGLGFVSHSDERIKRVVGHSDATHDLRTLMGIEVTDYSYVDTVAKGTGGHKKVIAQQVEKVFPQAVSKSTEVVPDIYQKATQKDGWVQLATNLKQGERVRLIGDKNEGIHEVLEVTKDKFRTDFKPEGGQVFVYGREVKDFRSVDYEEISMLNVSATQELARKVKAQESELTELRAELAKLRSERKTLAQSVSALQARDEAREARLIKLELSLQDAPAGAKARTQARAQSPAASGQLTSLNQ